MSDCEQLFTHLWRGGEWAYFWTSKGKLSKWFRTSDPLPALSGGKDYYFGVHPPAHPPDNAAHRRSTINTVCAVNCLFGEFDARDFNNSLSEAENHIHKLPHAPSVIIFSGGGYHCYWLLCDTFRVVKDEQRTLIDGIQKGWVSYIRSDGGAKDMARVLRIPGTRNYKPKYAPDYPMVTIIKADYDRLHSLGDFAEYADLVAPPKRKPASPADLPPQTIPGYLKWFFRHPHAPATRNKAVHWTAFMMYNGGFSLINAEQYLLPRAVSLGLGERESLATIRSPYKK